MSDLPQGQLNQLLSTYGNQLCEEQQRCEALLRDTFPEYPRQLSLLVNALKQGVPKELLASHNKVPFEVTRSRLTRKLTDEMFVQEQAAQWVIDSWSEALGVGQVIRPGTMMQPPEVSGGKGNMPSGGYAPTAVSGNSGNSGNYNNPANYNPPLTPPQQNYNPPPNYNDPGNYNPPPQNYNQPQNYNPPNYGAPVNYGGNYGTGTPVVRPSSGPPGVWIWYIVYCVFLALGFVSFGLLVLIGSATDTSSESSVAGGVVAMIMLLIPAIPFGIAPFLPRSPGTWVYHLILICLGLPSCYCTPFSIPLLIFWLQPQTKAYFNMSQPGY
jgi:hypothetical protein